MLSCGAIAAEEKYRITIDPIPDLVLGTMYIISGETNLPVGSELLFEPMREYDVYVDDTRLYDTTYYLSQYESISTTPEVQKGTTETNIWNETVGSSQFSYTGKSFARISSFDVPITIGTPYDLLESTPETPWFIIDLILDQNTGTPVTIIGSVFQPQEGTTESYQWNISLDTTDLPSDMYQVEVFALDYDLCPQNRAFLLRSNGGENDHMIEISPVKHTVAGEILTVQGSIDTGKAITLLYGLSRTKCTPPSQKYGPATPEQHRCRHTAKS